MTPNRKTAPHSTKRTLTVDRKKSEVLPLETIARRKSETEKPSEKRSGQRQPGGGKGEPSEDEETVHILTDTLLTRSHQR